MGSVGRDRLQLGICKVASEDIPESAEQGVNKSEQINVDHRSRKISWDDAIAREMEYRKRTNKLPQHSVDPIGPPSRSQEQLQRENAIGLKRKATYESFPHPNRKVFECQMVGPQSIESQPNPSQRLYVQNPPSQQQRVRKLTSQQFEIKKCLPQPSTGYQPPTQPFKYFQSSSNHLQRQRPSSEQIQKGRPLPQRFFSHTAQVKVSTICWCKICNVKCMTPLHLELHYQGKKHKARLGKVCGGKKNNWNEEIWCPECNVMCVNDFSWNQHCMGQKHLACIAKKAIEASDGAGPVIITAKVRCVQEPQKARTEEQKKANIHVGMPDNKLTSPVIHNPKLKTSNWPNCI